MRFYAPQMSAWMTAEDCSITVSFINGLKNTTKPWKSARMAAWVIEQGQYGRFKHLEVRANAPGGLSRPALHALTVIATYRIQTEYVNVAGSYLRIDAIHLLYRQYRQRYIETRLSTT